MRAAIIDYLINHCTFADVSLLFSRLPLLGSSKNGECSEIVPGIVAYSFKISARDELASELGIQVSDKGGRALFGKSPAQFNALTLRAARTMRRSR